MKLRKLCTCITLTAFLMFFINQNAYGIITRISTWDLVDSGKHLDWDGSTKYQTLFNNAINTWETYKPGVIRKDTTLNIQDVAISDYYEINDTGGITNSSGTIKFNTYNMDKSTIFTQQNVCLHELGHALRLDHNTNNDVMYKLMSNRTTLSDNDKASYDLAYNWY